MYEKYDYELVVVKAVKILGIFDMLATFAVIGFYALAFLSVAL